MKSKLIPLFLVASVCIGILTGCQSSKLHSLSEDLAKESASPDATENPQTAKDYSPCFESYDSDEVMLSVNGIDVTWDELFYWYVNDVTTIENYFGEILDWDAECNLNKEKTNREFVMGDALDIVKQYSSVQSKAKDMGVSLTDEDKATLQSDWENNVQSYGNGDEAAFIEYLKKLYLSKDMYDKINQVNLLYNRLFESMFGANGEKLSENEVVEKAADMGYVRVKNILIMTKDDTNTTLPEDQLKEKKATAEKILSELKGTSDKAALEKRFDELMAEYGEDPGMEYNTDGYTFLPGNGIMIENFEKAATELDEYGLSEIVETDYGYHIILKLPLRASATALYSSDSSQNTLAYYIAQEMMSSQTKSWADESKVEFSKTYEKMNIADVFSKAKTVSAETN